MEDRRESQERTLCRCYQCHRLEEQLWALAYEQVWPVIRKALPEPRRVGGGSRDAGSFRSARIAIGGQRHG